MSLLKFTDEERKIVDFRNDKGKRGFGDPFAINRRFNQAAIHAGVNLESAFKTMRDSEKMFEEAIEASKEPDTIVVQIYNDTVDSVMPLIHEAFGTTMLDPETGEGLTEEEAMLNYHNLREYLTNLGKPTGDLPSSSTPTDSPPAASP